MSDVLEHGLEHEGIKEKLRLLKSPVRSGSQETLVLAGQHRPSEAEPDMNMMGNRMGYAEGTPEFQRHEDASTLELFFDLFFAANYSVFSETQAITSSDRFRSYVGYFCVLWITWVLVGLYDVRYVTDSIFERCTRGLQLGVMVGFAVVAPHFNPQYQDAKTMKIMSLILMVSRFVLGIEYMSVLWHVRKFKKAQLGLIVQVVLCFIAGFIYLGIAFRFKHEENSNAYLVWYVISGIEILATFGISNFWAVLSFTKTHLMRRMSLLTIIILGDAIIIIAKNVVTIVESSQAWDSLTIGIVTAATATVYFVFLVYFDWMKHAYLPAWRQQLWTFLHFPMHLSLTIFTQGLTQFLIWSKVIEVLGKLKFQNIMPLTYEEQAALTTEKFNELLTEYTIHWTELYPIVYTQTSLDIQYALNNITEENIPDSYWPLFANNTQPVEIADFLQEQLNIIYAGIANSMFAAFKIDIQEEINKEQEESKHFETVGQEEVINMAINRYYLIFQYGYICAGLTLMIMTILTVVSRTSPWRIWPIIRTAIVFCLGLGLSAVAAMSYYPERIGEYLSSAWLIPTMTITWFVVLVLTHINNGHQPFFFPESAGALLARTTGGRMGTKKEQNYDAVNPSRGSGKNGNMVQTNQRDVGGVVSGSDSSYHPQQQRNGWQSTEYDPYEQPHEQMPPRAL